MIISKTEFLLRAHLDQQTLEVWIQEEWLSPDQGDSEPVFSEADVARACLIRDLQGDLGVNKFLIPIFLSLQVKFAFRHLPFLSININIIAGTAGRDKNRFSLLH